MELNNLIGVSGTINSGKDLVGEMIQYIALASLPTYDRFELHQKITKERPLKESPYDIKKCADKLKEVVALIIGCKRSDLEDETFKNARLGEQWDLFTKVNDDGKTLMLPRNVYENYSEAQKVYWKLEHMTPRIMLQRLGTQGGRMKVHANIWVNALFSDWTYKIDEMSTPLDGAIGYPTKTSYPKWIITDVRFPQNEGIAVSSRGGLLIGIKRHFALKQPQYGYLIDDINEDPHRVSRNPYSVPSELEELNPKLYDSLTHESETSMGDYSWCDVIIENNGTKEELFDNVLNAVTIKIKENV